MRSTSTSPVICAVKTIQERQAGVKVLTLHGVNHNMFGKCDAFQSGSVTLADIDAQLQGLATELGVEITAYQRTVKAKPAFTNSCSAPIPALKDAPVRPAETSRAPSLRVAQLPGGRGVSLTSSSYTPTRRDP
jgi:hypothetical protein